MGIDGEKTRPGLPTTWRTFRVAPNASLQADGGAYGACFELVREV